MTRENETYGVRDDRLLRDRRLKINEGHYDHWRKKVRYARNSKRESAAAGITECRCRPSKVVW
jgi:hypothetical protein